jgi:hypothetical protein
VRGSLQGAADPEAEVLVLPLVVRRQATSVAHFPPLTPLATPRSKLLRFAPLRIGWKTPLPDRRQERLAETNLAVN